MGVRGEEIVAGIGDPHDSLEVVRCFQTGLCTLHNETVDCVRFL